MNEIQTTPEAEATPIPSRKDVSVKYIRIVRGMMDRMGRLYRERISPSPKSSPTGHLMTMYSKLQNRRRELVGEIRVSVYVPEDEHVRIMIKVDWTRNAFGFWYRNEIRLPNSPDPSSDVVGAIKDAMRYVKHTADGDISVASMNRGTFRKIKRNKVHDKSFRSGMVMG